MMPGLRNRLHATVAVVWAVFTVSLATWWLVFGLQQAERVGQLGGPHAPRLEEVQRMLVWEGAVLIGLLVAGGVALVVAVWREQQRQRAIEAFFMAFTHELKTTLASLQLQAESLQEDLGDLTANRNLDRLLRDAVRLQVQFENSLYFAQPDGRMLIEPLDVEREIAQTAHDWPALAVRVAGNARALADARAMQSVLRNVFQNAVVHGEASAVDVDVARPGSRRVVITIADNGRGAADDVVRSIGEPFARPAPGSGTGVGLYVSRQLVQRMHGSLEWRRAHNGGFAVVVELPEAA
jgi:signal transduction histidine kinase